jgi:hypothetical protein
LDKTLENVRRFLLRAGERKNYNIFIVLLESWAPCCIDFLSNENYGVVPNFDEIVANRIAFINAYANGTRSIFRLSVSFLNVVIMSGMLSKFVGLEFINNVLTMSEAFNKRRYFTMFVRSSAINSLQMHDFQRMYCMFRKVAAKRICHV